MHTKEPYMTPEAEVMIIRMESGLLTGSPQGAQTEGFTTAGTYTDEDWDVQ